MTRKILNIVFILLGILAFYLTYQFYYVKNNQKVETISKEVVTIQERIDYLDSLLTHEKEYRDELSNDSADIAKKASEFASDVKEEDIILYAAKMEDDIKNMFMMELQIAQPALIDELDGAGVQMAMSSVEASYTFSTDYKGAKSALDRISDKSYDKAKRAITEVDMTYNNTNGELTGMITYAEYLVTNSGNAYKPTENPEKIKTGTDNIFGGVDEKKKDK